MIKAKQIVGLDVAAVYSGMVQMGPIDAPWTDAEITVDAPWLFTDSVINVNVATLEGILQGVTACVTVRNEMTHQFTIHAHAPKGAWGTLDFNWQGTP